MTVASYGGERARSRQSGLVGGEGERVVAQGGPAGHGYEEAVYVHVTGSSDWLIEVILKMSW